MAPRLHLTGAPAYIDAAGHAHPLVRERRTQLLVILALAPAPGWVPRSEVAALLWPELDAKLASANLRKTLFRLDAVPWGAAVEQQQAALRVVLPHDAGGHMATEVKAEGPSDADLLVGFDDDANPAWTEWLHATRQRHRRAWREGLLTRLSPPAGERPVPAEAITLAERLLVADPFDEAALQALLDAFVRAGEPGRARQRWREFRQRLADELGAEPGAELAAWQHSSFDTLAAPPLPVPVAVTQSPAAPFIGRTAELRHLETLLAEPDCRLVTLLGPGGIGKTRVARQAMTQLAPRFADGAIWLALEDIHGPDAAEALASALAREGGVTPGGSMPLVTQVLTAWGEQALLVVLDNFEQLAAEHTTLLETLLAGCPRLKLLVTSRVRLGIAAEWLLPLAGLPCPEPEDIAEMESFDAARLLVQTARRLRPAFVPAAEAEAIVAICRLCGGLPLAIEMAAAWTRVMPCAAIAAELRQGLELLAARDRTHPPRHASIEQVFDQSWRLLDGEAQRALARLAIFRGGFDAEAARHAAGVGVPLLATLTDASLLRREAERLFMHPLVHQFAAQRLASTEGLAALAHDHAQHYLERLAALGPAIEAGSRDALQAMDAEFENLRAAWVWAAAETARANARAELLELLARGLVVVKDYCDHRGRFDELLAWTEVTPSPAGSVLAARRAATAAHGQYRLDRYAAAHAQATAALLQPGRAQDDEARLQCLKVLGAASLRLNRLDEARRWCEQALALATPERSPRVHAALLGNLGLIEKGAGRYDEAQRLALAALAVQRRVNDPAGEALTLNNLAALHLDRHEYQQAGLCLKPALALCDRHGLVATRGMVLANLTGVALYAGDADAAGAYAERALAHAQAAGNRYLESFLELQRMRLAIKRNDLTAARWLLRHAAELAIGVARPVLLAECVTCLAELLQAQGERRAASRLYAYAAAQAGINRAEAAMLSERSAAMADGMPVTVPPMALLGLVQRITAEAELHCAPLVAELNDSA